MKFVRPLVVALSLTLGSLSLLAQTPAAPAAAKPVPASSIAYINSNDFLAEEGGVKQLLRVMKELELEFSSEQSDISLGSEKLRTIVGELQKLQAGGTESDAFKAKQAEGIKLQQELQAKQQEFQAALGQAQQAKQGPVVAAITKAINDYAKEREIGMLLDLAKLGDAVIFAKPELEVTDDFVAYFNAKNP